MKTLIFTLILVLSLFGGTATDDAPAIFISDEEFTEQYTYSDFFIFMNSYDNSFTEAHIKYIYTMTTNYKISQIVIAAKLQQEQSLVNDKIKIRIKNRFNWAMSYCLAFHGKCYASGNKHCPHEGFTNQIDNSTRRLRALFNIYKVKKPKTMIIGWGHDIKEIKVGNAASFALYKYTPVWGKAIDGGVLCSGNALFLLMFKRYRKRIREIAENSKKLKEKTWNNLSVKK